MTYSAVIDPHVHECNGYFHYTDSGLSPYWTIRNLVIHELGGDDEITTEIGGEPWTVSLGYNDSGIAPRESDAVERELLRDWKLHLEGPGEKSLDCDIRARFDDMERPNGEEAQIAWKGGEGIDLKYQATNVEPDRIPALIPKGIREIAANHGFQINQSYLARPDGSSNITAIEYYVRIKREPAAKLVRNDGAFYRIMHLLAGEKGTEWTYTANNEEIVGHRHAIDLGPSEIGKLALDYSTGARLKHYHPKHARDEETTDDPLSSPKFGVAFHKSIDGGTRKWRERDEIRRELCDVLINVLSWAGIPVEPDPTTFVPDDHFRIGACDLEIPERSDPTPELEAEQETMLLRVLDDLTPAAREVTREVATDGGTTEGVHYADLAERTDKSVSTIYRVLDEIGGIAESDDGFVKFTSQKIREEIVGMVNRLDELKNSTAERVAELANIDLRSRADSALEKWAAKYGAEIVDMDPSEREGTIRIDTILSTLRSADAPHVEQALREGLEAWIDIGRDRGMWLDMRFEAEVIGGSDGRRIGAVIGY